MSCKPFQVGEVSGFVCRRGERIDCVACGGRATEECQFKLKGRKEGQICGRPLCSTCVSDGLCPAHARLKETALRSW